MQPITPTPPDESMDGYVVNTHYVPIRQEWSYILDRRRNEALSAFRFDIASFLRVPLEDVKDLLVRPDIHMIEFQVKYTKLLTLTDVNAILKRCEFPEMTLLVYDSYYPNGIPLDIHPQGQGAGDGGGGGLRPQLPNPRDPSLDDRAYRMFFPGKYWEDLLQTWRVEAELAAKKDILEVLQSTEINQKMPEIITTFKSEPDGTWLVYRVEDTREDRRAARRDFFARSPFSNLWALYAEHSAADPGWMTRGVQNRKQQAPPGAAKPSTYASSSPREEAAYPAILSEEPDGEVHFPGTRWPLLLQRRLRDLKKAGKQDLINVLGDHGEAFLGAPHVKVRFESQASGAKMQCKILNAVGLSSSQVEARRRIINGYHYPLVMAIYDNFDPKQAMATGQRGESVPDNGVISPRGAGSSSTRGFKLPQLVSSPKRRGGGAGSPNTPRHGDAAGSPRGGSSSRHRDPSLRTNLKEYNDQDGQRPCTYRVSFPGSMWRAVLTEAFDELHTVAVLDVKDMFMQVEKLMRPPNVDVTFTLKPEKKGLRAFFLFHDHDFKKPTKVRHGLMQKCSFAQTWGLYRSIRDSFQLDNSTSMLSRTRMEVDRSMGSFSGMSRLSPNLSMGPSSPRRGTANPVVPSSRGSFKRTSSTRQTPSTANTFPVNLNEPAMNVTEPTGKGLELYIPFPDVQWGESYALEKASDVDRVVRRDIQTILTKTGAISEAYDPPCILATFVPTGHSGAMLYIKFSRKDRKVAEKSRPALLDYRNYVELRNLYSSVLAA